MSCKFYEEDETHGFAKAVVRSMNGIFFAYCRLVRLKTREFYKDKGGSRMVAKRSS